VAKLPTPPLDLLGALNLRKIDDHVWAPLQERDPMEYVWGPKRQTGYEPPPKPPQGWPTPEQWLAGRHRWGDSLESPAHRMLHHPDPEQRAQALRYPDMERQHPNTPEFLAWFGNSHVVDHQGKPRIAFHGTRADFSTFDPNRLGAATGAPSAGLGFFFSGRRPTADSYTNMAHPHEQEEHDRMFDEGSKLRQSFFRSHSQDPKRKAAAQAKYDRSHQLIQQAHEMRTQGGNVMPVYLSFQNPYIHDMKGKSYRDSSYHDVIQRSKALGHDSTIVRNTYDAVLGDALPDDIYIAHHPHQIKSALSNQGFDAKNPDITKAEIRKAVLDPKLGYTFSHKIHTFTNPDETDPSRRSIPVLEIHAHAPDGTHVGSAEFDHGKDTLEPGSVFVLEPHRRQGIASAMYAHAEKITGKKVVPSRHQTKAGEALWTGNAKVKQFGKSERKFRDEARIWLAGLPLEKMAIDPDHLKSVARYHDPKGADMVDHKPDLEAHPLQHQDEVSLFRTRVIDSPEVVKRGKTGTRESSNSTGKSVYDVTDDQGGSHRFMVKPYHEKIVPRMRGWMHPHPTQGWAEMTNQALYHAAGIGDLHQHVHVAEVPLTPKRQKRPWTPEERERLINDEISYHSSFSNRKPNPKQMEAKAAKRWQEIAPWDSRPNTSTEPALVIHMQPGVETSRTALMSTQYERPLLPVEHRQQLKKIGLMDFLTNNLDRHGDNLLWDEEGKKFLAVDHSRSFQYKAADKGFSRPPGTRQQNPYGPDDKLRNYFENSALGTLDPQVGPGQPNIDYGERRREQFLWENYDRYLDEWQPVMGWWEKNRQPIRDTMAKRLPMIQDGSVREHVARNFERRARMLDEYARDGIENYGQRDWWESPVPIYRYGTNDHEND
jgi:GNAT superfamily N-acetyltransferase